VGYATAYKNWAEKRRTLMITKGGTPVIECSNLRWQSAHGVDWNAYF